MKQTFLKQNTEQAEIENCSFFSYDRKI